MSLSMHILLDKTSNWDESLRMIIVFLFCLSCIV